MCVVGDVIRGQEFRMRMIQDLDSRLADVQAEMFQVVLSIDCICTGHLPHDKSVNASAFNVIAVLRG